MSSAERMNTCTTVVDFIPNLFHHYFNISRQWCFRIRKLLRDNLNNQLGNWVFIHGGMREVFSYFILKD